MTLSKAQFFESTTESHDLDTEFFTTAPNTPMQETNIDNPGNPGDNPVPLENLYVLLIAGIGIGFYFLRKKPSMN